MSVCVRVCLCVCVRLCVCLSLCLFVCLCVCLLLALLNKRKLVINLTTQKKKVINYPNHWNLIMELEQSSCLIVTIVCEMWKQLIGQHMKRWGARHTESPPSDWILTSVSRTVTGWSEWPIGCFRQVPAKKAFDWLTEMASQIVGGWLQSSSDTRAMFPFIVKKSEISQKRKRRSVFATTVLERIN